MKQILLKAARTLLGRKDLARLGRALSRTARLDIPNELLTNGELLVLDVLLRHHKMTGFPPVVFDCGANVGHYVEAVAECAADVSVSGITVHAFEPSANTFATLQKNVNTNVHGITTVLNCVALSDEPTPKAQLHVAHENAGSNSLLKGELARDTEIVQVTTLERYCATNRISRVLLLKIDTEGNDFNVLLGAGAMLRAGNIAVVQFEYNCRWIYARRFLRDAFELLVPLGYEIGKVTPEGIEYYAFWHPELETYVEGNYLACRPAWKACFPSIKWWAADHVKRK